MGLGKAEHQVVWAHNEQPLQGISGHQHTAEQNGSSTHFDRQLSEKQTNFSHIQEDLDRLEERAKQYPYEVQQGKVYGLAPRKT